MTHILYDAAHWHGRAAEMRLLAETMKDPETQRIMYRLADDYDAMGDKARERDEMELKNMGQKRRDG